MPYTGPLSLAGLPEVCKSLATIRRRASTHFRVVFICHTLQMLPIKAMISSNTNPVRLRKSAAVTCLLGLSYYSLARTQSGQN